MNKICKVFSLMFVLSLSNISFGSETHIVKMLNNSDQGSMVFEPAFIKINKGDSI